MSNACKLTFVLPGRRRSGGVLATASMGNELLSRGYDVRIAWREFPRFSVQSLRCAWQRSRLLIGRRSGADGLSNFRGRVERFCELDELVFSQDERVIAVGSMTVDSVRRLHAPVVKIRYCHGFTPHNEALMHEAWGFSMPTIAVSESLVEHLKLLCGHDVLGVVPNGLDECYFYVETGGKRDGVGAIYGDHFSKDPETLLSLFNKIHTRHPGIPLYLFSQDRRPHFLECTDYLRMPSIDNIRRLYNQSLVWVVPSRSEGFGMPILEAMACGAAVVSTHTEGAQNILCHNHNGLLANIGDVDELLSCVELLLNNNHIRQQLVDQGRLTARSYSWTRAADRLEECFSRLKAVAEV